TEETTDNTKYDGVDIAFNHALSAVQIKAKTQGNYSREIRITSLKISEVENTNTFKQNVNLATVETPDAAAWATREQGTTPSTTEYSYITTNDAAKVVPFVGTDGTTTILDCGTKILLPQAVQDSGIKLTVSYEIEYGVAGENNTKTYLAQTTSFDLKEYLSTTTANVSIINWEMGKRYIYTLVFTLDEIFFEPSVTDWVDVTIGETTN
ncbi:MAG: fimbrillin family protein, partial [Bacteroidales bacterium]|nr:fimbrillin family protein [Bacteroidales bacterium]